MHSRTHGSVVLMSVLALLLAGCAGEPPAPGAPAGGSSSRAPSGVGSPQRASTSTRAALKGRLVYEWYAQRSAKDLHVYDGAGSVVIADDVETDTSHIHPDWSPDGKRIAFESLNDATAQDSIWVVSPDGSDARPLVTCRSKGCVQYAFPSYSHEGDALAVLRFDALPNGDWGASAVEVVDLSSGKRRVVAELPTADRTFSLHPSWSPDDSRLVVQVDAFDASGAPIGERLAVISASGPRGQRLTYITRPGAWAAYPDWHPTRDLIVFNDHDLGLFQSMDQPSALWTVRSDGSRLTRLTSESEGKYAQPSWSPDGRLIVFSVASGADEVSSVSLATIGIAGGEPVMLSVEGAHARFDPSG